jgi:hypothetical protein
MVGQRGLIIRVIGSVLATVLTVLGAAYVIDWIAAHDPLTKHGGVRIDIRKK